MRTASINMSLLFVEITQTLTLRLGEGQKLVPEGHDSGTVSALSRLELAIDMEYVEQRELHSSIIGSRRSLEPPKLPIYHFDGKACHSSQILQTKRIQPAVIYKVAVRDTSVSKYPSLGIHATSNPKNDSRSSLIAVLCKYTYFAQVSEFGIEAPPDIMQLYNTVAASI